ncbi:LysR family transcriptional regulator [Polaromonas sp. UC242_47]|uniref:LysR family transcriptional regulator n=1 Tax=Polaromonas sp. UC242_47 TaxID=3374626 RepID=UPI0037BDBBFB
MRYRLEDIEAFVAVVETGSISAAAVRLDVAKSVISKRVTNLESCLGVALLQRSTRHALPTISGMQFFERSKAIMQDLDEAAQSVSGAHRGLQGTVRLALPMSFGHRHVLPALMPFFRASKDLIVHMDLDDRHVDLVQGGYDMAIRIGVLADSNLIARRLARSKRVLCCSPGYLATRERPTTLAELAAHDRIGYGLVSSSHVWQFHKTDETSDEYGDGIVATNIHARVVTNNGEAMVQAALAGLGITVLPTFLINGLLRSGALVELALDGLVPTSDSVYAVYTQSRNLPSKVRTIIDLLAQAWAGEIAPWDRPAAPGPALAASVPEAA